MMIYEVALDERGWTRVFFATRDLAETFISKLQTGGASNIQINEHPVVTDMKEVIPQ